MYDLNLLKLKEEFKLYLIKDAVDFFDESDEGAPHIKIDQSTLNNYSDLCVYNTKYSDIFYKIAICETLLSQDYSEVSPTDIQQVESILLSEK